MRFIVRLLAACSYCRSSDLVVTLTSDLRSHSLKSENLRRGEILFIACLPVCRREKIRKLSLFQAKMMLHRLATTAASRTVRSVIRPRMLTTAARSQYVVRNTSAFLLTAAGAAAAITTRQRPHISSVTCPPCAIARSLVGYLTIPSASSC